MGYREGGERRLKKSYKTRRKAQRSSDGYEVDNMEMEGIGPKEGIRRLDPSVAGEGVLTGRPQIHHWA